MKSAFDIAKEISKDTAKTYPKAFNVAKRMEAKKNSMGLSHSQELTKKVFGQKGRPFSKVSDNQYIVVLSRMQLIAGYYATIYL